MAPHLMPSKSQIHYNCPHSATYSGPSTALWGSSPFLSASWLLWGTSHPFPPQGLCTACPLLGMFFPTKDMHRSSFLTSGESNTTDSVKRQLLTLSPLHTQQSLVFLLAYKKRYSSYHPTYYIFYLFILFIVDVPH